MRDCVNAEMRDRLPDLLHDRLPAGDRAAVESHLSACDACRAELALLARVRESATTPPVNVAAVVQALPGSGPRRQVTIPMFRVAAAAVFVVGVAALLMRDPVREPARIDTVAQAPAVAPVLSLGESFQDLSDSDLEALTEQLRDLEATLSEEPEEIVVPIGSSES